MGEHPEGLRQPPGGESVGRIALVEDREGRDEALVLEIGIEVRELLGDEHALVDERARRQRADIEVLDGGFAHALLDAPPAEIKPAFEFFHIEAVADVEYDLLDFGARRIGLLADDGDVHRHLAPAIEIEAEAQHFGFDDGAAGFLGAVIGAGRNIWPTPIVPPWSLRPERSTWARKKSCGTCRWMPAPSPVLPSASTAPRCQTDLSASMARVTTCAARLAVDRGNQADAAGIVFHVGRIGMRRFELLRIGEVACDFDFAGVHG